MERWFISPSFLPTRNSLKILNLGFSLDMERWLTPSITDGWVTVNFKLKILPEHEKMIDPPLPLTRMSLKILNLRRIDPHQFSFDMERWLTPIVTD